MFPIIPTALAVILCLTGIELEGESCRSWPSPLAALFLLIVPIGELAVFLASSRKAFKSVRTQKTASIFFSLYPLCSFSAAILFFGWCCLPRGLGISGWILLDKAVLIASYLGISCLTRFYRDRFLRAANLLPASQAQTRLALAFRGELTVVIPFLIFISFTDLITTNERLSSLFDRLPLLLWGSMACLLFGMAFVLPWIVKVVWNLKSFPPGSIIKHELLRFMKRQGFEVRDILIWPTGNLAVNAAFLGLSRRSRYIIFTDTMLKTFSLEELEAVMAHELGHGKHRHILLYLIFSAAFIFGISLIEKLFFPLADPGDIIETGAVLIGPAILLYWWLVFGFLSRRFEMEADFYGAGAVEDPRLFIDTLNKVAFLSRVEKRKSSWRHFSIERRAGFIEKTFFNDPGSGIVFKRKMKRMRRMLLACSIGVLLLFSGSAYVDSLAGAGLLYMEKNSFERAQELLELACKLPGGSVHRCSLIALFIETKELDRAADLLEQEAAAAVSGSTSDKMRAVFVELSLAFLFNGEMERCNKTLEQGSELFPGDPELTELKLLIRLYSFGLKKPLDEWITRLRDPEGNHGVVAPTR